MRFIGPVKLGMQEHCSSLGDKGLDGTFGSAVHVLGANAGEGDVLSLLFEFVGQGLGVEDTIVSVVFLDAEAEFGAFVFEEAFAGECFISGKSGLVVILDQARGVVIEYSTTTVLLGVSFASGGVGKATLDGALVLVDGDEVARIELVAG